MAFPRRRGRPRTKKDPDLGRLMIELRTRSKVWVPCSPEDGDRLLALIETLVAEKVATTVSLRPLLPSFVRIEAIECVTYFPAKSLPNVGEEQP